MDPWRNGKPALATRSSPSGASWTWRRWVSACRPPIGDVSNWNRKTQIAVEFAVRLRKRSPETWVFWVQASNTATFTQSYREITEAAKIPGRDDPKTNTLELVSRWMKDERNGPWLMIVDNIDDSELLFSPLGPIGNDHTYSEHSTAPVHANHVFIQFLLFL